MRARETLVNRSKKSNIKCDNCEHWKGPVVYHLDKRGPIPGRRCALTGEHKAYWNRCKQFEWDSRHCNVSQLSGCNQAVEK